MLDGLSLTPTADGVVVAVVVQPRASKAGVTGIQDGALRVRVTAPPVDGAANDAVVKLLAEVLRVPRSSVSIVSGQSSRRKRAKVGGIDAETVRGRLLPHVGTTPVS